MLRVLLDANNDLPEGGPVLATGVESVRTGMQAVFGTQQGEWPFDFRFGTPWRNAVLQKYFDPSSTRSIMATTANSLRPEIEPVNGTQIELDTLTQADERQVNITLSDVQVDNQLVDITIPTLL